MGRKPETRFSIRVGRELKEYLPGSWFERVQQVSTLGTPDRLGCVSGRFVGLETKDEGEKPSPIQKVKLELIRRSGGYARVIVPSNWEEVLEELIQMEKTRRSRK